MGSSLSEGSWDGVEVGMVVYVCSEGGVGGEEEEQEVELFGTSAIFKVELGEKGL